MSPYATHLARARLDALRQLVIALNQAESPDEKRRCAVAILSAPDPSDLDDELELEDEDVHIDDDPTPEDENTTTVPPSIAAPGVGRCNAATHASLPATTPAATPDSPSSTSDIRPPPSHVHRDLIAGFPHDPILTQAATLMDELETIRCGPPPS